MRLPCLSALVLVSSLVPGCSCGRRAGEPVVLTVEPAFGPAAGGTSVVVTGEHFDLGATVRFGGELATAVMYVDETTIMATTPPGNGMVSVSVENPNQLVGFLDDGYEFRGGIYNCRIDVVTPAFGVNNVDVTSDVELHWTQAVDPATVEGRIELRRLGHESLPVTVEVDGDTVIVHPDHSLRFWEDYGIIVSDGVTDLDGNPCAPSASGFSTVEPAAAPRALRPAPANGIARIGDHVITTSRNYRGVQIYDVSSPASTELIADLETSISPLGLTVHVGRAYAPAGSQGVLILDVTDPAQPAEIGVAGTPGAAADVAAFDRDGRSYIAVADGAEGVRFYDVTEPDLAVDLGALDPSGARAASVRAVAVNGDLIAIADGERGVEIARILDPEDPGSWSILSMIDTAGHPAVDVAWSGDILYVSQYLWGLWSYDATDPAAPALVQVDEGSDGPCGVGCANPMTSIDITGSELHVSTTRLGVLRYAIDPAGTMTYVDTLAVPGSARVSTTGGGEVYVGAEEGVLVFDRAAGGAPIWFDPLGHGSARSIAVAGDRAYVAASFRGLQTFDLGDPMAPAMVDRDDSPASLAADTAALSVLVTPGNVILGDARFGVTLYDRSNPDDPVEIANIDANDQVNLMDLAGDTLYVCDDNSGVAMLDVSDPANPVEIGRLLFSTVVPTDTCMDLLVDGDILYVGGRLNLFAVDVADPAAPQWIGLLNTPGGNALISLAKAGDYLYAVTQVRDYEGRDGFTHRLAVFDIAVPTAPALLSWSEPLGAVARVVVVSDKAFVPARDRGVIVFDLADPIAPVLEGAIATPGDAIDVARGEGVLYVVQGDGGLQALVTGLLP